MRIKSRFYASFILFTIITAPVISADVVHILARGETLYSLARHYGVSLEDLLKRNSISDPSGLSVGTRLLIPGVNGTDTAVREVPRTTIYTVRPGDTYYGIARKHNLEVDQLLSLNSRNTSRVLRVGETLIVSTGAGNPEPAIITQEPRLVSAARVSEVPWWPVAGYKQALNGKLVGVSIEADPMSYVHAVAGGSVVWTGPYRGFGNVVLVDSNGYIYLYGGNEDLFVNVGQSITTGSRIGRLGSSGPNGGKQDMIFSVFREGVPVSPDDAPRG